MGLFVALGSLGLLVAFDAFASDAAVLANYAEFVVDTQVALEPVLVLYPIGHRHLVIMVEFLAVWRKNGNDY